MKYKVITGLFISGKVQEEFENNINEALSDDWELQGGVCFSDNHAHQALVKK